jgi:hypothetical protein
MHRLDARGRGRDLKYRPELIPELRYAHRILEQQMHEVLELHRRSHGSAWLASLARFDRALRTYLTREALQLERYLSLTLAADGEVMQTLRDVRVTLRALANTVGEIVELRELHQLQQQHFEAFGTRLEWLDTSLRECFALMERQIFPHYFEVRRSAHLHPRAA